MRVAASARLLIRATKWQLSRNQGETMIGTGACLVCDLIAGGLILLACLGVAFIFGRNRPPPDERKNAGE
jgi:hypothetical protein